MLDDPLWTIDATLTAKGFQFVRPPAVYRGSIPVHGRMAVVEIDVPDPTFIRMPKVKLLDRSELPVSTLAHLGDEAEICYADDGGLPLDLYNPGGSVLRVLIEASAALERSFAGGADEEFERELASYWRGKVVYFAVDRPAAASILQAEIVRRSADKSSGLIVVPKGAWKDHTGTRSPVTILNFPENLRHTPEFRAQTLAGVLDYIAAQSLKPPGWRSAVIGATVANGYVFLAAPNALIGWSSEIPARLSIIQGRSRGFREGFFRKMVEQSLGEVRLERLNADDVSLRFCVERNLAGAPSLIGKRIAMIGCGTVGGYLGRMLVQAGAGCGADFSIYDPETLRPGNLGRHTLGFDQIGLNKARALAAQLQKFHPDVTVSAQPIDATAEWSVLEKVDLIIDATGEQNVASALNRAYLASDRPGTELALLHAWVFGNGVAGQSFLNLKDGLACYRCLTQGFGGEWRYNPLRDAKSETARAPGRCGEGGYVPFAVDASMAAAGLAMRAALDWASGKPGQRMRTTVVDHVAGRDKVDWASPKPLSNCPACSLSLN